MNEVKGEKTRKNTRDLQCGRSDEKENSKRALRKGLPQEQGTCLLVNVPRLCHLFGQTASFMPYCLILLRQFLSLPSQESSTVDKCQKQALLNVNMTQSTLIWQQTQQGVCVGYIN